MRGTPPRDGYDGHARSWRGIRRYGYVERHYDDLWPLLVQSPASVLGCDHGVADGAEAFLRVRRGGLEISRPVRLRFGGVVCEDRRARLALRWEDAHHPRLFPVLEAVLELAPLVAGDRQITQVGVVGRYRPPFGALGGLADRLAGEEVAAESVAAFVDGLVGRLEALVPESPAPEEPPGDEAYSVVRRPGLRRVLVPVDGLRDRPGGAAAVSRYLAAAPGVARAEVEPQSGLASVEYDPGLCHPAQLMQDLEDDRGRLVDRPAPVVPPAPGEDV